MAENMKVGSYAGVTPGADVLSPFHVFLPKPLMNALYYRWLVFTVLAGGYVLVYFHRLCPAVLAVDMMRDLNASGALLGLLGSAYFYPYALMQLPAGLLADSWGARRTITVFTLIAFAGAMILGLASTVGMAILGRVLVGVGASMLFVPTMKVLTEWFRPQEFARMTGILLAMGGLGSLFSATPLALVSEWMGWRMAFTIVALATLFLAVLVWLLVRDRPGDFGMKLPMDAVGATREPAVKLLDGVKQVLANRFFWPLAGWFFFQSAVFFTFAGLWGGPYLQHIYLLSGSEAGQVLSLVAVGLIIGGPLQTWMSNRVFKGRKPVLIMSAAITTVVIVVLLLVPAALTLSALSALCLLLGMFTSASVVVGFSAAKELFSLRIAGTAIGLINLFPFAGGAALQPLFGWVLQQHVLDASGYPVAAYRSAFALLLVCALLALICSCFVRETFDRRA